MRFLCFEFILLFSFSPTARTEEANCAEGVFVIAHYPWCKVSKASKQKCWFGGLIVRVDSERLRLDVKAMRSGAVIRNVDARRAIAEKPCASLGPKFWKLPAKGKLGKTSVANFKTQVNKLMSAVRKLGRDPLLVPAMVLRERFILLLQSFGNLRQQDGQVTEIMMPLKDLVEELGWIKIDPDFPANVQIATMFTPIISKMIAIDGIQPECIQDNFRASPFEERCESDTLYSAINMLKLREDWQSAEELFAAFWLRNVGPWKQPHQIVMTFIPGLDSRGLWQAADDSHMGSIAHVLESNYATIRSDLDSILRQSWAHSKPYLAYPFLTDKGKWWKWGLFGKKKWDNALCQVARKTCDLLKPLIPSRAGANSGHWNGKAFPYVSSDGDEEVLFFETEPGSHLCPHTGAGNTRLNMHMGLKGIEGSKITIYGLPGMAVGDGTEFSWKTGKIGPIFDDSFDHSVDTPPSKNESRFIFVVGVLHPSMRQKPGHYAGAFNRKTRAGDTWSKKAHKSFEKLAAMSNRR